MRASDATLAALPLAAGLTLALARVLPIHFVYRENELGIVSPATLARYPLQQEPFWLLFAALAGALLAWGLARAFASARFRPGDRADLEALGALGLVLALWLPGAAGSLGCAAATCAAFGLARRRSGAPPPPDAPASVPRRPLSTLGCVLAAAGALFLAALLTPPLWLSAWNVATGVPDERLTANTFLFFGEIGQHLAWADAILRGGQHGRDFFCLYGPLYDLAIAGFWSLVGRSIAAYKLYDVGGSVVAYALALLLCAALLRRRWLALALPFLLPLVDLRMGLALGGLLLLSLWHQRARLWLSLAAGFLTGTSLLFSQEFGLALLLTACAAFAVTRELRAAGAFAAGFAAILAAVLGAFALRGALGPMLANVFEYPLYVLAGFGKRPFPSLLASLPLELDALRGLAQQDLRLGYAIASICGAALLLSLPLAELHARQPLAWLRRAADGLATDPARLGPALLALFGALCFRSALGRSDITHILMVLPPAALLLVVAGDRLVEAWVSEPRRRPLVATRAAALLLFVLHAGLFAAAAPLRSIGFSLSALNTLARVGYEPVGSDVVNAIARWIRAHTQAGEPVLFLPDAAAYYYLTERPSPIRFVVGHQMVTDAHRAEALASLRAAPPRYVVFDHGALRIDAIAHRRVLGEALFGWIDRNYREQTRIGKTSILRRRDVSPGAP